MFGLSIINSAEGSLNWTFSTTLAVQLRFGQWLIAGWYLKL